MKLRTANRRRRTTARPGRIGDPDFQRRRQWWKIASRSGAIYASMFLFGLDGQGFTPPDSWKSPPPPRLRRRRPT